MNYRNERMARGFRSLDALLEGVDPAKFPPLSEGNGGVRGAPALPGLARRKARRSKATARRGRARKAPARPGPDRPQRQEPQGVHMSACREMAHSGQLCEGKILQGGCRANEAVFTQ